MQIYNEYASIYHAIGQASFGCDLARRWLAAHTAPRRVLDLACGTGDAALVFAAAGSMVVGVDRSSAMLNIAHAQARDQGLTLGSVRGDLRHLDAHPEIGADFDLITCWYDSLNYILEYDDLVATFGHVARLLRPDGRFVFDLNTPYEFAVWDDTYQVVHNDQNYVVYNQLSFDPHSQLARGRIVWFVREFERWWRGEETHSERAWSDDAIVAALGLAGLEVEQRLDPQGAPLAPTPRRVVYHVQKRA